MLSKEYAEGIAKQKQINCSFGPTGPGEIG